MHIQRILTVGLLTTSFVGVASAQFEGPAPLAWRFVQPSAVPPAGSPLVRGDRIYQSVGSRIVCLDRETGNQRFIFPPEGIPGNFRSGPAIGSDVMIAAGDNRIIYAADANTGQLKWTESMMSTIVGQPVIVGGNTVVFATGDNRLHALDVQDGRAIWENPLNVHDGINGTIAAHGNSVILFNNRQQLVSYDLTTRRQNWALPFQQVPPNPRPIIEGDNLYAVSGSFLIVINPASGQARWQENAGMQLAHPPAVSQDAIFVISNDGRAMGFDYNRRRLFPQPLELGSMAITAGVADGKRLIVPTVAGGVVLLDGSGDKPGVIWNYLIRPFDNPAATAGGGANRGGPTGGGPGGSGFDAGGGGPAGSGGGANSATGASPIVQASAAPVIAGSTLLVPTRDGSLLAFDRELGVDLTPPSVRMVFPNPCDQISGQPPFLLAFRIADDASGLQTDTVKVMIDGTDYDHQLQRDGLLVVRFSQTGKNRPLRDGRRRIVVQAKDYMGNEVNQEYVIMIDNTLRPVTLPGQDQNQGGGGAGGGRGGGGGAGGRF
jgi:uncharacterized membrane protein YgcG